MITIRKASVKDVPLIFELWNLLEKEHNAMILQKTPELKLLLAKKKNMAEIYKKNAKKVITSKKEIIYIAEKDGKPAGYIELTIDKRGYSVINVGVICDIFVKKEFRKLGVSSKLKQEAIKWFKSKRIKCVGLNVYMHNKQAYSVYKRWGFSDTDIRMMKKI
ncbi:MAG: GNAT family N-acetyltransferase [Nanoarchaeota archaeon]